MTFLRFFIGCAKLAISALLSVLVVFVTYRVFVKANTDFDEEVEIKKGNVAVGILVTALLLASANIIQNALGPVMNLVAQSLDSQGAPVIGHWKLLGLAVANLAMAFIMAVVSMSFSLRVFGKLTRSYMVAGQELHKGNVAVGLLLSGVVLVVGLYIGDGISSLAKALIPQPTMGAVQIMR